MIISEVNSLIDLVGKATNFATHVKNAWYKGSTALDEFQDQVLKLNEKQTEWTEQLRRHGLSEDETVLRAADAALELLDKEENYVRRLQTNRLLRWWRRTFPAPLRDSLNKVLSMLDAGPQLLAQRVANYDLMERGRGQTPVSLPFDGDRNYVPLSNSIPEIQKVLEDVDGPRVVTVYGGPGVGKSSAIKYLALHFQEERKHGLAATFPDGVYYLFCGKGAQGRVRLLQLELMECLGFGAASAAAHDEPVAVGVQGGDYFQMSSNQMKLRSRLLRQTLLIILDDLWETEVLQQLLVPVKGVKYLVTSQNREIWGPAEKILLKKPSMSEAQHILANYTHRLSRKRKFPDSVQTETHTLIQRLDYHPLSLANIGISIPTKRATDARYWKAINGNIHDLLDENNVQGKPIVYDRPYSLTVGASMMLMVESLSPKAQQLLFLLSLFEDQSLPEPFVKFFHKFLQTDQTNSCVLKFYSAQKYLIDRSLIEILHIREDDFSLDAHSLRMHYVRESKPLELRSTASHILATSDLRVDDIQSGAAEGTLLMVLSAMYFEQRFKGEVEITFQKHRRIINGEVIPQNMNFGIDALQFVTDRRHQILPFAIKDLIWLLNVDDGAPGWKRQAHGYVKKIIIKLACQGKLDDGSMASLVLLPQSTSYACGSLWKILMCRDYKAKKVFSSTHPETMKTLLSIFYDDAISTTRRAAVCRPLSQGLLLESDDTILSVIAKATQFLAMDSNPNLQLGVMQMFPGPILTRLRTGEQSRVLKVYLELVASAKDYNVRFSAVKMLKEYSILKSVAWKIAAIPDALPKLLHAFISKDAPIETLSGNLLFSLSCVPENRMKVGAIEGCLEGLGDIIANMKGTWQAIDNKEDRRKLKARASIAAGILGELSLENQLRENIAPVPGLEEGLLFLELVEVATNEYHRGKKWYLPINSTSALAMLRLNPPELPTLDCILEARGGPLSLAFSLPDLYFNIYWTRVEALTRMGAYKEALQNLDLARHYADKIQNWSDELVHIGDPWIFNGPRDGATILRDAQLFLQVMSDDHAGALFLANKVVEAGGNHLLIQRGIVKRMAKDFQGALNDFNVALDCLTTEGWGTHYTILKHRGYVKYLMGDEAGAREDAEAAQLNSKLIQSQMFYQENFRVLWEFELLPLSYLGYSL